MSAGSVTLVRPMVEPSREGLTIMGAPNLIRGGSHSGNVAAEALAGLKPAFKKDGGSVTAGNASGINDAAAAVVLASAEVITGIALLVFAGGFLGLAGAALLGFGYLAPHALPFFH